MNRSSYWNRGLAISLGWLILVVRSAGAQSDSATSIDFASQIAPILLRHCHECHGPLQQSGGVRFDQRDSVAAGGYSQHQLIGGTLQSNEIYRRVASRDASYRMPKGRPPLSDQDLELIRRWINSGTPWPAESTPSTTRAQPWFSLDTWLRSAESWITEVPGCIPWLCVMLVVLVAVLGIQRYQQAVRMARAWTAQPRLRWLTPLRHLTWPHLLLVLTCMTCSLLAQIIAGLQTRQRALEMTNANLAQSLSANSRPNAAHVYGDPPQPIRPTHPPRLAGTYYRGNCERGAELFNNGNYRTATLHLALIDGQGQLAQYGQPVATRQLAIRLELERAPGTTNALFGDSIPKGVFLTQQVLNEQLRPISGPLERMQIVTPDWKWTATFPLPEPVTDATTQLSGLIYVYHGTIQKEQARGTVHYGIQYDLRFKERTLQAGSEIWMGSLFWTPELELPHTGQVPLKEWFNHEPIPEITGPNTTDPKSLGIPAARAPGE